MKAASIDGPLGLLAACPVFDIEILYHAYIMNLFWGQINCILSCLLACHVTRDSKTTFKSKVNLQGAGAYSSGLPLPHSLLFLPNGGIPKEATGGSKLEGESYGGPYFCANFPPESC